MEHPAVAEAGVIGSPDPVAGEVSRPSSCCSRVRAADEELRLDLIGFGRRRLGGGGAQEIAFDEHLPKTRSGKVMRRLLKARELGLPEGDLSTLETGCHAAPAPRRTADALPRPAARCCGSAGSRRAAPSSTAPPRSAGFLHLYIGEEAVAAGVMPALAPTTPSSPTYREHGHALARGVPLAAVMAEMFGKQEGAAAAAAARCTSSTPPRASTAATPSSPAGCPSRSAWPWPTRCAGDAGDRLLLRRGRRGRGRVPRVASTWPRSGGCPVLFCCENNLYAMGTALERSESRDRPRPARRRRYGIAVAGRSTAWTSSPSPRPRRTRRRDRPRRRGPLFPGAAHLPVPGALDVRPRALPRQGRGRRVERARPDRHARRTRCGPPGMLDDDALAAIEAEVGRRDRRGRAPSPRPAPSSRSRT